MSRWLDRLALPGMLLGFWLLLHQSLAPSDVVTGLIFAVALTWFARIWRPVRASMRHPLVAIMLCLRVGWDIVKSCFAVSRIVLLGERAQPLPGFLNIPLRLRDPHGLAALACIITFTPGTVWSAYCPDDGVLVLHVLDLQNEAQWLDTVQRRYEEPLLEIFE